MAALPATLAPVATPEKVSNKSPSANSASESNSFGDTFSARIQSMSKRTADAQTDQPTATDNGPVTADAAAPPAVKTTLVKDSETKLAETATNDATAVGLDPALLAVMGLNPTSLPTTPTAIPVGTPPPDTVTPTTTAALSLATIVPANAATDAATKLATKVTTNVAANGSVDASTDTLAVANPTPNSSPIADQMATTDPNTVAGNDMVATSEFAGVLSSQAAKIADPGKSLPVADMATAKTPTVTATSTTAPELVLQPEKAVTAVSTPQATLPVTSSEAQTQPRANVENLANPAPVASSATSNLTMAQLGVPMKGLSTDADSELPLDLHATVSPATTALPQGLPNVSHTPSTSTVQAPVSLHVPVPVQSQDWGEAVGNKVIWMSNQNTQVAEMQLNPPNLGPMEVRLTIQQDQATLSFVSQNAGVREALQNAIPKLNEMLANTGLNLSNVQVGAESFQQQADQNAFAQQQQQFQRRDRRDSGDIEFGTGTVTRGETTIKAVSRMSGNGKVDLFA